MEERGDLIGIMLTEAEDLVRRHMAQCVSLMVLHWTGSTHRALMMRYDPSHDWAHGTDPGIFRGRSVDIQSIGSGVQR